MILSPSNFLAEQPTERLRHWAKGVADQGRHVPEFAAHCRAEARLIQAELARRVTPVAIAHEMERESGARARIVIEPAHGNGSARLPAVTLPVIQGGQGRSAEGIERMALTGLLFALVATLVTGRGPTLLTWLGV
jgi:hypothetical protein